MALKENLGKKRSLGGAKPPNLLIVALLLAFRSCAHAPSMHATNKMQSQQRSKEITIREGKHKKKTNKVSKQRKGACTQTNTQKEHARKQTHKRSKQAC